MRSATIRYHGCFSRIAAEGAIQRYIEIRNTRKWPYFGKFGDSHRGLGTWFYLILDVNCHLGVLIARTKSN